MTRFYASLFIMNCLSFFGSLFFLFFPLESTYRNGTGLLLLLTLTGNIIAAVMRDRSRKLAISYLILSSFGLLAVMLLNTLASLDPENGLSRSTGGILLLLLLIVLGGVLTNKPPIQPQDLHKTSEVPALTVTRKIVLGLLGALLLFGVFLAFVMVTHVDIGLIEVPLSQYSVFYSLIFLSLAGLFLKLLPLSRRSFITYTVSALGIGLYILFALPFLAIPSMLDEAEESYTEAFGDEWKTYENKDNTFRNIPFSVPDFFFGLISKDYQLTRDVLFYEGTEGVDDGLDLRFDVYSPPAERVDLPGERSVLIRIHGGGWDIGDKGFMNMPQVNKYFASQGYVVFDVQYGLNDQDQFLEFVSVPDGVSGPFDIDDMIRHLGQFTTYLADNHEEYDANIDSVFVSGGSAGGHLGTSLALASASGQYTELVDPRITVNGIIPLYPANNLSHYRNISGETELVDPELLVDENSPPALIFQGDRDGFVDQQVSHNFRDAYLEQNNSEIAVITMPYGAHASDIYFPGFYNQTFIYYMERFMYQYK